MHRLFHSKVHETNETANHYPKPSTSRRKSSAQVLSNLWINPETKGNARIVRIRVIFIRIGEIDTLNEKYQADVYYEARWTDKINLESTDIGSLERTQILDSNLPVRIWKFDETLHWLPQLFIENAIGQIGEQEKWFTMKRDSEGAFEALSPPIVNLTVCEHRRIRGVFWEKLELNHFPADVQDLTVSISTHRHTEHCVLLPDEQFRSSINREAFFDQQEWKLYQHVAIGLRQIEEEYSILDDNTEVQNKKHSVLSATCRAARRPGYYYWNGFCLIFLITLCAFCIFSIPPDLPQSRLQITCTLLLTSVTFRWIVNRSLPTVSYLTTLDQYAIISIIMLVVLCLWHSIIATIIFVNPVTASGKAIEPTNIYVLVDRYMFVSLFVIYIIIHIALIVWLIFVPYRRRREMEFFDREYSAKKYIQIEPAQTRYNSMQILPQDPVFCRRSSMLDNPPSIRPSLRSLKNSDGTLVASNGTIFLPIREESSEKTISDTELHEQDDVFYDQADGTNDDQNSIEIQAIKNV